ncbi:hypothetical protein G7Y89_g4029 [Cudoniella acicularis]|uniref:Uncharacterized protein n=1 Tax=Cudoniella acicularis TaxID=354080 RepID=A0A8H4RQ95_9HELO|nr:hypothetical protein G7Y89_g4029 [Cudoniella acicularis]
MLRLLNRATFRQQCRQRLTNETCLRTRLHASQLIIRYDSRQHRSFGAIPTILLPPVVFGGLVIALWTWKCFMMIIFQNKIIYMPGLPPNSRRETISEYHNQCGGIQWREERIKSLDGTRISLVTFPFQSDALAALMRGLEPQAPTFPSRRPSEKGIAKDAAAALQWIKQDHGSQNSVASQEEEIPVVIWGQSIGAGVATTLSADQKLFSDGLALKTLILETPFLSIRAMLETLYPQKWLPYRYLWPFLRNHLDSWQALGRVKHGFGSKAPRVLILEAARDELVPSSHGEELEKRCLEVRLDVQKRVIDGALHTEVMVRQEGLLAVVGAIQTVAQGTHPQDRKVPNSRD